MYANTLEESTVAALRVGACHSGCRFLWVNPMKIWYGVITHWVVGLLKFGVKQQHSRLLVLPLPRAVDDCVPPVRGCAHRLSVSAELQASGAMKHRQSAVQSGHGRRARPVRMYGHKKKCVCCSSPVAVHSCETGRSIYPELVVRCRGHGSQLASSQALYISTIMASV